MIVKLSLKDFIEWLFCFIIAIILALLIRHYVITLSTVKQPSMYPTIKQEQKIILDRISLKLNSNIKRGDIVTFEAPSKNYVSLNEVDFLNPVARFNEPKGIIERFIYYFLELNKKSYIKRVIALPGEHILIKNGKVYINGEMLKEDYLGEDVSTYELNGAYTDIIVPPKTVFLMGDNRLQSTDSRQFGCIPVNKLEGKFLIRIWPLTELGIVE